MILCPTIVVFLIFLQVIPVESPYIVSIHHLVNVHPGFCLFIESAILLQPYLPAVAVYPDIGIQLRECPIEIVQGQVYITLLSILEVQLAEVERISYVEVAFIYDGTVELSLCPGSLSIITEGEVESLAEIS